MHPVRLSTEGLIHPVRLRTEGLIHPVRLRPRNEPETPHLEGLKVVLSRMKRMYNRVRDCL